MKEKQKNIFTKVILLSFLILYLICIHVFAYWDIRNENLEAGKLIKESIGRWYVPKSGEPEVEIFDEKNPPNKEFTKGTLIYFIDKNGNKSLYTVYANKTDPNNPNYVPDNPTNNWAKGIQYVKNTIEYVPFNVYQSGDLVVFKGHLYEYTYGIKHNPNTTTGKNPDEKPALWKKRDDLLEFYTVDQLWFRYKVYLKGERVIHNDRLYVAQTSGYSQNPPDKGIANWRLYIGK